MSIAPRRSRLLVTLIGLAAVSAAVVVPTSPAGAAPVLTTTVAADDGGAVWSAVDEPLRRSVDGDRRRVNPSSYAGYHLDLPGLESRLDRAPAERGAATPLTIAIPSPEGDLVRFSVRESPVMEAGLAAQHPDIHTYAGTAADPASPASIRLDVTPMGFHASVRGDGASWYVDPAYNGPDQGADALYLSYRGDALPARDTPLVEPDLGDRVPRRTAGRPAAAPSIGEGGGAVAIQRTYRLALVSDPSYATYFTSSSDQSVVDNIVTAEKVTLMNRVNQLYNDDFSVRMILVAGNDALNFNTAAQFTGTNGRCGNLACYDATLMGAGDGCYTLNAAQNDYYTLSQNRIVAGQLIGADNYDIGHIMFGPDGDGGGIAGLGVVGTYDRADGCTGLNPPTGDGWAIDYVAHEMGHQFGGDHTFNGNTGSCGGGNRNTATSVEPGSGSSVMAYAGICGVDDLQPHTDPYFSQRSQTQVAAYTRQTPGTDNEIQNVALTGFDSGEAFTMTYGANTSAVVTSGGNYSAAGIKAAVEAAEPSAATATVTGLWGLSSSLTNGFQITWSGTADVARPSVDVTSGTFGSVVGITDNGGSETLGGFDNPAPSGNHNPTVTAPAAKTIPLRTPFTLTGSGTDPDGDALTYLWEQNDSQSGSTGTKLNSNSKGSGPLFRIFGSYANVTAAGTQQYSSPGENLATSSPSRSFPDAAQVAAGSTNAATGSCPTVSGTATMPNGPTLECYSEFLPTSARTLNFRLTARDLGGSDAGPDGGTSFADTAITVGSAGPFAVSSQSSASTVSGGGSGTVTWDVAGTNSATYATNVKISFSTDGGLTFPTVLVASTSNDGSESVTWPNVATSQGRIKVEAVDNYFYDVSDGDLTIVPGDPTDTTPPQTTITSAPQANSFVLARTTVLAFDSTEADSTFSCSIGSVTLDCSEGTFTLRSPKPGSYEFSVTATDAAGNVDPTPATRRFSVPVNDRSLKVTRGPWKRASGGAFYRGTVTKATTKGASLTLRVTRATTLALVVTKAPGAGAVEVFLGKQKLRTIRTNAGSVKHQALAAVSSFGSPRTGTIRIVTTSAKPVQIEGVGVRTAYDAGRSFARGLV